MPANILRTHILPRNLVGFIITRENFGAERKGREKTENTVNEGNTLGKRVLNKENEETERNVG